MGTMRFVCGGNYGNEVRLVKFPPRTLMRLDSKILTLKRPSCRMQVLFLAICFE